MHGYSRPERDAGTGALPDLEVFQASGGWFYWLCFPGCLPESDSVGPFETAKAALKAAQDAENL